MKKGTAKKTSTAKPMTASALTKARQSKVDFVCAHANLSPNEIIAKVKAEVRTCNEVRT